MSTKGNRSHPNQTRIEGGQDGDETRGKGVGAPEIGRQGGATHQETRDHNKHNHPGQSGHKPQKHSPDQEKH
jgi:hypothetical protein